MKNDRSHDWLNQAEKDLLWAFDSLSSKHFSQTCFICQQIGKKSLKALAHKKGFEPRGHSIKELAEALSINGDVLAAGKKLDLYYISSRYPDAFPSGSPSDYFSEEQAKEAYQLAELIFKKIKVKFDK